MRKSLFLDNDSGLPNAETREVIADIEAGKNITHADSMPALIQKLNAEEPQANFMQVGDSCAKCGMFVPDHAIAHTHNDDGTGVNHFPEVVMTTGSSDDPYVAKRPLSTKMCWEWNWPQFWGIRHGRLNIFNVDVDIAWKGDHAPSLYVCVVILGLKLLDFGYYNIYHDDDPEFEGPECLNPIEATKVVR